MERIPIADDHVALRNVWALYPASHCMDVSLHHHTKTCVEMVSRQSLDLIVLDMMLSVATLGCRCNLQTILKGSKWLDCFIQPICTL
jgi:CheY-like chemotaxis protein